MCSLKADLSILQNPASSSQDTKLEVLGNALSALVVCQCESLARSEVRRLGMCAGGELPVGAQQLAGQRLSMTSQFQH